MNDERIYIVTYDISDARRWRRVFRIMKGFGEWLQLSVFQCRLSRRRRAELEAHLYKIIKTGEDHVLRIDIGPADRSRPVVKSIGKTFEKVKKHAVIL